jgi:hypothetical protein
MAMPEMPLPKEFWERSLEKLFYSLQLSLQLEDIHRAVSWLAKHRHKLPRRVEYNVWGTIEDDIAKLLSRLKVIAPPRRRDLKKLLNQLPVLQKKPNYREWRKYILGSISVAEGGLDLLDLLLTSVSGSENWEEEFFDEVLDAEETLRPYVEEGSE